MMLKFKAKIILLAMVLWIVILLIVGILLSCEQYILTSLTVIVFSCITFMLCTRKKGLHYVKLEIMKMLNENGGQLEYEKLVDYFTNQDSSIKGEIVNVLDSLLDELTKENKIRVKNGKILTNT